MRKKYRLVAAVVCLAAMSFPSSLPSARATTVPVVETPAALHSENVHLLSNFPTGEGVGGHFATIDGQLYYFQTTGKLGAIPAGGGYGYQNGTDGGVWAFNASNPEQPTLAGHLPIVGWENEDADISESRKLLFYIADNRAASSRACSTVPVSPTTSPTTCKRVPAMLYTVDISNPSRMTLVGLPYPLPADAGLRENGKPKRGGGHTASCYDADCNYLMISAQAGAGMLVLDTRVAASPKVLGTFGSPAAADNWAYTPGSSHDGTVDRFGNIWVVGSGGTAMYAKTKDPLKPKLLATTPASLGVWKNGDAIDATKTANQLVHHAALRLDKNTVIINEEWFTDSADCGGDPKKPGQQDGRVQMWSIDLKHKTLKLIAKWDTEVAGMLQSAQVNAYKSSDGAAGGIGCSAHWFDINPYKVITEAWYEMGVRFLDMSKGKIRQIGYYAAEGAAASQALWVPGRPDLAYVADYARGLDVLKIDGGGKPTATTAVAPVRAEWLPGYTGVRFGPRFVKDDEWGWACARIAD